MLAVRPIVAQLILASSSDFSNKRYRYCYIPMTMTGQEATALISLNLSLCRYSIFFRRVVFLILLLIIIYFLSDFPTLTSPVYIHQIKLENIYLKELIDFIFLVI